MIPTFVIRSKDIVHRYLNRCAHRSLELDWNDGDFFDIYGEYLPCATRGAQYAPASGACVGGSVVWCRAGKTSPVVEKNGEILLELGDDIHLVDS
jgi:nitrite reductase/ring-hydroxylating ferredoxin subunit